MSSKSQDSKYSRACRQLISSCSSVEELTQKMRKQFKLKSKRDKGWVSANNAAHREWKKQSEMKKASKKSFEAEEEEKEEKEDPDSEEEESEMNEEEESES